MVKKINIGIIGFSEGNGHPYSFSAIINGFNKEALRNSGWDRIYNYTIEKDAVDFGFTGFEITHIWSQYPKESLKLSRACNISNICSTIDEMVHKVDAVIIARDDYLNHYDLSKRFLDAGKFVFIDKPLSIDIIELKYFKHFLLQGKLMSCAGFRYAKELDAIRATIKDFGNPKLIKGTIVLDWMKYGIHLLDGIFNIIEFDVVSISFTKSNHDSFILYRRDGSIIQIDALNNLVMTFQYDFWSDKDQYHASTNDNFIAFRRTLFHFTEMIKTGKPQINPELTLNLMKTLIAGNISKQEKREVRINEITI